MFLQKKNTTKAHLQKNEARVFFYTKIKMEQKKNTLLQQKTNSNTEKKYGFDDISNMFCNYNQLGNIRSFRLDLFEGN